MANNSKKKISEKQMKILETISILALLSVATISYFFTNIINRNKSRELVIFSHNIRITEIDGTKINDLKDGTYTIDDGVNNFNTIEIKGDKVRCIDANCPDKICVSHSYLNPDIDNDMIICAPHRLVIQYR